MISVAKHHTIIATDGGEVFTWGSNRGQLFFLSCNVQAVCNFVLVYYFLRGYIIFKV